MLICFSCFRFLSSQCIIIFIGRNLGHISTEQLLAGTLTERETASNKTKKRRYDTDNGLPSLRQIADEAQRVLTGNIYIHALSQLK